MSGQVLSALWPTNKLLCEMKNMPSEQKLDKAHWEKLIPARQEMFFGSRSANPEDICSSISHGALVLGAKSCSVQRFDDWWFVSSEDDWINATNKLGINESNIFNGLHAFPEAGQNWHRSEVMSFLFSSALATHSKSTSNLIKGTGHDFNEFNAHLKKVRHFCRVIGFKFKPIT